MKILRKLSEDPKILTYLGIMLALGVILLLVTGPFAQESGANDGVSDIFDMSEQTNLPGLTDLYGQFASSGQGNQASHASYIYERILERRLEEALSLVEGAGDVRVMVTFSQGRETVFAVDRNTNTSTMQEQDAQGGTRYQSSQQSQEDTLIVLDRPLVIKETPPVIGGVMIIAEGGDNVLVRDGLIRATSTLLSIDINRVQVLKMK